MDCVALDARDPVTGVKLVPAAIEVLGDQAELDDQDPREVGWSLLAALFAPEPQEGLLVLAHDDPGVRADCIPSYNDAIEDFNLWDVVRLGAMAETFGERRLLFENYFSHSATAIAATVAFATIVPFTGIFQVFLQPGWVDPALYLGAFLNLPENLRDYGVTYQSMRLPFTLVGYVLHHSLSHVAANYLMVLLFNAMALTSLAMIVAPRCGRAAAAVAVLWLGLNPTWIAAVTRGYVDGASMAYAFAALAFFFNRDWYGWPNLFAFLFGVFSSLTLFCHPAAFVALGIIVIAQYCFSRDGLWSRLIEFVFGVAGLITATALLACGSHALGGEYLFFSSMIPNVGAAFSGFGVYFQYPLASWLPMAVRLAPPVGLVLFSAAILLVHRRSANQVLVSGAFGLVVTGALMIVQDSVIGGVFLQSSYYAGYLLIGQSLIVGSVAGVALQRGIGLLAPFIVAALIISTLTGYLYVDVLWNANLSGWAIWSAILVLFIGATVIYLLNYPRSALALICFATFISGALNEDTRNVFRAPGSVDYGDTYKIAMQTFDVVQQIAAPDSIKLFMFNRDDLTAADKRRSGTTYRLLYKDVNYVMNLWDTIAALWGWDQTIVGGYAPDIFVSQLGYLQSKDRPRTTIVSFCMIESRCDFVQRVLSDRGFPATERGRAVISGSGYLTFFVRVIDL
jgi:hypothetical protein